MDNTGALYRWVKAVAHQHEFQILAGIPINTTDQPTINRIGEVYIFKAIEELVELRKTFPSTMNPHEKNRMEIERVRMLEEFVDVMLFLTNFALAYNFTTDEILSTIESVQKHNFNKLRKKLGKSEMEAA